MPRIRRYHPSGVLIETLGTMQLDWQERINMPRMRVERREKVREQLRNYNLGAILLNRDYHIKYTCSAPRFEYLSETNCYGPTMIGMRYAMLFEPVEKATLYEHGGIASQIERHAPWLNVKYAHAGLIDTEAGKAAAEMITKRMVNQIKEDMKAAGVAGERLGFDFYHPRLEQALKDAGIKVDTQAGIDAMADAMACKTSDEVECTRIACTIGEACHAAVKKAIMPGLRESDIVRIMNDTAMKLGGNTHGDAWCVCSGPDSWPNQRTWTDRILRPGEVVFVDVFGCRWNEYHTCQYLTYVCGKAWPEIREAFKKVATWQREPLEKGCKAGNTTADIAKWFPSAKEWGAEEEAAVSGNAICHGIGLHHFERPLINREWSLDHPIELKEGMVFAIESQCGDGLGQGVRLEDIVHVLKDGYELLTVWPIDDIIECPY